MVASLWPHFFCFPRYLSQVTRWTEARVRLTVRMDFCRREKSVAPTVTILSVKRMTRNSQHTWRESVNTHDENQSTHDENQSTHMTRISQYTWRESVNTHDENQSTHMTRISQYTWRGSVNIHAGISCIEAYFCRTKQTAHFDTHNKALGIRRKKRATPCNGKS